MVSKELITQKLQEFIDNENEGNQIFFVDLKISNSNNIDLFIDSFEGITIKNCREVSKYIESQLDREQEDFQITVSSAGLDLPFRVKEQYIKNINKEISVKTSEGNKHKGKLLSVNEEDIEIQEQKKVKKKKVTEIKNIRFENIKSAKVVISFK
jgi:ribosome maturation factor RimP